MRCLFCHILATKTVAMENAQRSRHCEHSSSRQSRVFTKRLPFSRKQCKQTKEERDISMYYKHAKISNHQWGDLRLINKMAEKNGWAGMYAYCQHDTTTEAGEAFCLLGEAFCRLCEVNTCHTNWAQFKGRRLCGFILQKWPYGFGCSLQPGNFNKRNLKHALILSCQPNEISNDNLNWEHIHRVITLPQSETYQPAWQHWRSKCFQGCLCLWQELRCCLL